MRLAAVLVGLVALALGLGAAAGPGTPGQTPTDASRPDASPPPPAPVDASDASVPDAVPADASPRPRVLRLTAFDPKRAQIGERVAITGDGFQADMLVAHGGALFPVREITPTEIVVVVPVGARGTHRFVVGNRERRVESGEMFEVIPATGPRRPPPTPRVPMR